jgi:PAS domain S-box-containing protein
VLDKALQGLEDSNFAFPLVTKDGRRLEILLNATSRKDAEGRIIGVVGIGQDITARIAQEQEFSRLIDTANAPIFGVDSRGAVNVWNQHASRVVGFSAEETFGRPFVSDFITEDFRASVQDVLDKALLGDETANFHLPLMTKSGARVEILLNATSRKDAEGHIIGVVGIGQDITARIAQVSLEMLMNGALLIQGILARVPEKRAQEIRLKPR